MQTRRFCVLLASLASAVFAAKDGLEWMRKLDYCNPDQPLQDVNSELPVRSFGFILYQGFDTLDVMGPLEALQTLARKVSIDVSFIGETMDPVSSKPAFMTPISQTAWQDVVPTHTYDDPPSDLEVLMIPGGAWTRDPHLNTTADFLQETYPKLKYFFTACTGSYVAARSGLLNGKRATTNKAAYNSLTPLVPKVDWVPHARWVVDGNIWTTSGVSAGMDGTLALIECLFGTAMTTWIADQMEYERHANPKWDPFAAVFNVTDA